MSTDASSQASIYTKDKNIYTPAPFDKEKDKAPSPFVSFMKKIWNAIKWVFEKIGEFFKNLFSPGKKDKLVLDQHEIEMIQNAKPAPKSEIPLSPRIPSKKLEKATQMEALLDLDMLPAKAKKTKGHGKSDDMMDALDLSSAPVKPKGKKGPEPKNKTAADELPPIADPVMKEFHETAQKFVETVLECVFDKKIEPHLTDLKKGMGNLSSGLKFGADLAFKIGEKAGKPIFEKLKNFSIDEKSEFQNLLKWLLKEGVPPDFESKLKETLAKDFEDAGALNKFTAPCLEWLLNSDHKEPIFEAYKAAGIEEKGNKEAIDKVYEAAMLLLLDQKIAQFIAKCNDKLEGKLTQIMRQMVVENGKKISDLLVRRILNVVDSTQFPAMFDTLVKVGADQTAALAAVEKAKDAEIKAQQALLEKAKLAKKTPAKTEEEKEAKLALLAHLSNVEKVGEAEWIARQAELKGLEAYRNFGTQEGAVEGLCHPKIAELMLNPQLGAKEKAKIEEELFNNLAEEIIPLLLPKQKVELPDGQIQEVDGLVYLCSLIDIPGEFREIAQEAVEISKEILTPGTQKIIKGIYDSVWAFAGDHIQESIVHEAKQILKKGMKVGAKTLFEQFITPNLINDMVGEELLPVIQQQLYLNLGRDVIALNQEQFLPLFLQLTAKDADTAKKEEVRKQMLAIITPQVQAKATLSSEVFNEPEVKKEFEKMMLAEIEAIENGISAYQQSKGLDSEESVRVALAGYFQEISVQGNPHFGEIAENLFFKIAKFNGTAEFFFDWFKGLISEQITSATKKISQSPHFILEKATEEIKARYLEKKTVEELLFAEKKAEKNPDEVEKKLQKEIRKTAKVARDLIAAKVDQLSWGKKLIAKPAVNGIFGNDEQKLVQLISTIYDKVLGNRLITHNLLVRCQEQVLKFLAQGSKNFEAHGGMKPVKVSKMPSIIPELFTA